MATARSLVLLNMVCSSPRTRVPGTSFPQTDRICRFARATRRRGGEVAAGPGVQVQQGRVSARKTTQVAICLARSGPSHEWHLVLGNAFRHLAFHLGAGLGQPVVVIAPSLFQPRLVAVGAVTDPVRGDGIE